MRKIYILLIIFLLTLQLNVFAVATSWEQYGFTNQSTQNLGLLQTNTGNFTVNSVVKGTKFQPIITDVIGDSKRESLIWDSSVIYAYDLETAMIVGEWNIGTTLKGQPMYYKNKYIALTDDGTKSEFMVLNFTSDSTFDTLYNFTIDGSGSINDEGVKCTEVAGTNYCIFMNTSNNIYRVNIDSNSFVNFNVGGVVKSGNLIRTPAITKKFGSNNGVGAFSFYSTASQVKVFVYLIETNTAYNFGSGNFGNITPTQNGGSIITNPFFDDMDGGNHELGVASTDGSNGELSAWDTSRTKVGSVSTGGGGFNIITEPFVTNCYINSSGLLQGWGMYSGQTGTSATYKFSFLYPDLTNSKVVTLSLGAGACAVCGTPVINNIRIVAGDITFDDTSELFFTINGHDGTFENTAKQFIVSSCDERVSPLGTTFKRIKNDTAINYSNSVLADYDNNNKTDIIYTRHGLTAFTFGNPTVVTGNQPPVLNIITPSTPSPINKGTTFYYTYTATDSDSDSIFGAAKCQIGTSSSPSNFSSANTFDTTHSPCNFQNISCKTSRIWITDNQGIRIFSNFDFDNASLYKDINISIKYFCGDGDCNINENHASCNADCPISTCGDSTCQATETILSCPIDCLTSTCGDSNCELKETYTSCPADCTITTCGNGYCNAGENASNCPYDNFQFGQTTCGDLFCSSSETNINCPTDCTQITCYDNICSSGENTTSCPHDCTTCGNGLCEGLESSQTSSLYCVQDCPSPDFNFQTTLVDINSNNPTNPAETSGLLPEMYLGIIAFFSPFLIPLISLLFIIGFVLATKVIIDKLA